MQSCRDKEILFHFPGLRELDKLINVSSVVFLIFVILSSAFLPLLTPLAAIVQHFFRIPGPASSEDWYCCLDIKRSLALSRKTEES